MKPKPRYPAKPEMDLRKALPVPLYPWQIWSAFEINYSQLSVSNQCTKNSYLFSSLLAFFRCFAIQFRDWTINSISLQAALNINCMSQSKIIQLLAHCSTVEVNKHLRNLQVFCSSWLRGFSLLVLHIIQPKCSQATLQLIHPLVLPQITELFRLL